MPRLFEFIRSIYVIVLFIVAEILAIQYYAKSNSYTQAKILAYTSHVVGQSQGAVQDVTHYLNLPRENDILNSRIASLEQELEAYRGMMQDSILRVDTLSFANPMYSYVAAHVISNSINKKNNFIVLNKGMDSGIRENMAVITPDSRIVGHIVGCTESYSVALSILSDDFRTSGKIEGGEYFGSISWDRETSYHVQMSGLSKYANIEIGANIVSTGFSQIFPEAVTIGKVVDFSLNEMETAYNVEIELAADLTALDNVLVVGKRDSIEIEELIDEANESLN